MIPAYLLHRLVVNLVDSASAIDLDECGPTSDTAHRERLLNFARLHELDLEDMATLFRVAAGEGPYEPVIRRDSFPDDPGTIRQPWSLTEA